MQLSADVNTSAGSTDFIIRRSFDHQYFKSPDGSLPIFGDNIPIRISDGSLDDHFGRTFSHRRGPG
jgi:hypothetical protein